MVYYSVEYSGVEKYVYNTKHSIAYKYVKFEDTIEHNTTKSKQQSCFPPCVDRL